MELLYLLLFQWSAPNSSPYVPACLDVSAEDSCFEACDTGTIDYHDGACECL